MSGDRGTPADTRMMGIVHDALRRDLDRAITALSTTPYPEAAQRTAIGSHMSWMMAFLHAHHEGEDAGLWPLVRSRAPQAAALLDAMEADHALVAPLADRCAAAASEYTSTSSDDARRAILDSLQRLRDALLPHLDREERETMPVVAAAITAAEWHAIDQEYFVRPKSFTELGYEGHWLLDGLDAERADIVVHQVPPLARLVLVHGFARTYRRRAHACWGDAPGARGRNGYGPVGTARRLSPARAGTPRR